MTQITIPHYQIKQKNKAVYMIQCTIHWLIPGKCLYSNMTIDMSAIQLQLLSQILFTHIIEWALLSYLTAFFYLNYKKNASN